jgi:hypothetical protein
VVGVVLEVFEQRQPPRAGLRDWSVTLRCIIILVNKRAGSLSSLSLVGLIDSIELSSQAELAERAELTT